MRKALCGFLLVIIFTFSGCAKVVSREAIDATATVVECTHIPTRTNTTIVNGQPYIMVIPGSYHTTLLYDDANYTISGSKCYDQCIKYLGKEVDVTVEIVTFDNDTVSKRIVSVNVDKEEKE